MEATLVTRATAKHDGVRVAASERRRFGRGDCIVGMAAAITISVRWR
jgi:hypothetical protein